MSYEQLVASVDALRDTNEELTTTVLASQGTVIAARDQAEASSIDSLTAATQSMEYSIKAKQSVVDSGAVASEVVSEVAEFHQYVSEAHRKFTVYIFEKSVVTGDKLIRISPQFNLSSQDPAIDWVGSADSLVECVLEFRVVNSGVSVVLPVQVSYLGGTAAFTIAPHNIYNGDVLEISCISGSATNLALTARYSSGDV